MLPAMFSFKDAYGRFVPPREWELALFGLAALALASVPVVWLLHGFANTEGSWRAILIAVVLTGNGLWYRRKRIANSRPFFSEHKR